MGEGTRVSIFAGCKVELVLTDDRSCAAAATGTCVSSLRAVLEQACKSAVMSTAGVLVVVWVG